MSGFVGGAREKKGREEEGGCRQRICAGEVEDWRGGSGRAGIWRGVRAEVGFGGWAPRRRRSSAGRRRRSADGRSPPPRPSHPTLRPHPSPASSFASGLTGRLFGGHRAAARSASTWGVCAAVFVAAPALWVAALRDNTQVGADAPAVDTPGPPHQRARRRCCNLHDGTRVASSRPLARTLPSVATHSSRPAPPHLDGLRLRHGFYGERPEPLERGSPGSVQ
uniref:Uncharacterized protein n=1 Tax=Setaria viridis TaxID=4556 RepID=A0A4U6V7P7_SETVI|nr:hypothetical protein SEVIR_3G106800v2 [Setaria viridis]